MMYKMPCTTPTLLATAGCPATCSGMPTKHSTTSTTPVTYAITRYRSTAASTTVISDRSADGLAQPVPPAVVLDLDVEPRQVGVVGAELVVLLLLAWPPAGLHRPDAEGKVLGLTVGCAGVIAALDPELIPDRLDPEHHGETGEQRPLERIRPAQGIACQRTMKLPVAEPSHPPERDHHDHV